MVIDPHYEEQYCQWYPYWEHGYSWDYVTYNLDGPLQVPSPRMISHTSVALSMLSNSSCDDSNDTILSKDTTTMQNVKEVSIVQSCVPQVSFKYNKFSLIALALFFKFLAALCLFSILCVNHMPMKIVRVRSSMTRLEAIMVKINFCQIFYSAIPEVFQSFTRIH